MLKYIARRVILGHPPAARTDRDRLRHDAPVARRPGGGDPGPVGREAGGRGQAAHPARPGPAAARPICAYLSGLLHGDLGSSLFTYRPVTEIIAQNFPCHPGAGRLGHGAGPACSGLALGVWRPLSSGTAGIDHLTMTLAVVSSAMPGFWLALLLIYLFSVQLGWLPSGGQGTLAAAGSAGPGAGRQRGRDHRPAGAVQHARGAGAGVRGHGASQGPRRAHGAAAPCPQERADPGGHGGRACSSAFCWAAPW